MLTLESANVSHYNFTEIRYLVYLEIIVRLSWKVLAYFSGKILESLRWFYGKYLPQIILNDVLWVLATAFKSWVVGLKRHLESWKFITCNWIGYDSCTAYIYSCFFTNNHEIRNEFSAFYLIFKLWKHTKFARLLPILWKSMAMPIIRYGKKQLF